MGARLSSSRKTRASLPSSSEPLPQSSRPQSISGAVLPQPQPLYTSPPASPLERNPQDASNFHLYSHDQLPSKSATLPPYSAPDMISMPAPHDSKSSTVPSSSTSPPQVPLYIRSPPPPRRLDTALSIVKECLSAVKEASDMFLPLKAALVGFVKVWEVYERTIDVRDDFIELAGKLAALNEIATRYQGLGNESLEERLGALTTAVNQLAEAIVAKRQRKSLTSAAQSLGDVAVVRLMFRRVSSLLEVFQFETQIRAESLLLMILQKLDTPAQRQVQNIDAVEVILAHMKEQHSSTREMYEVILNHLEHGDSVGTNDTIVNNNANENQVDGMTDLINNNSNENELLFEGRGGNLTNNNGNVNRVFGGANGLVISGEVGSFNGSNGSPVEGRSPWARGSIVNNNGNKNVVRRFTGSQPASPIQFTGSSRF